MTETIGLVQKFKIERNSIPYPPHEGEYFVLFPLTDSHARVAILAYADNVEKDNAELAHQIREWVGA